MKIEYTEGSTTAVAGDFVYQDEIAEAATPNSIIMPIHTPSTGPCIREYMGKILELTVMIGCCGYSAKTGLATTSHFVHYSRLGRAFTEKEFASNNPPSACLCRMDMFL